MTGGVRRRVVVHGRVHGVGFRAACAGHGARLGVAGWVRNRPDGTVEAVFEGPKASVDRLTSWAERGPTMAQVSSVELFDEPVTGEAGFSIC